jgi:hypothetical protein
MKAINNNPEYYQENEYIENSSSNNHLYRTLYVNQNQNQNHTLKRKTSLKKSRY